MVNGLIFRRLDDQLDFIESILKKYLTSTPTQSSSGVNKFNKPVQNGFKLKLTKVIQNNSRVIRIKE